MTFDAKETPKANRGPTAGPANRRALIDAAREIFTTEGYAVPLSAIARKAGVGQGTLYRFFPDRTTLAVAVFEENLAELEATTTTLDALIHGLIGQAMVSGALIDLLGADIHDDRVRPLGEHLRSILTTIIESERTAGRMPADVAVDDLLMAVSMLTLLMTRTADDQRAAVAERAWRVLRTGLGLPSS